MDLYLGKEHTAYDRLGQEIHIGSFVVAPYTRARTVIGQVTGITAKKVRFKDIDRNEGSARDAKPIYNKYHNEIVCIDALSELCVLKKLSQNI